MRFTLAQIQAFCRVVEAGTFHAAARQLNLSQPTISQRVRQLEAAIGATLFTRQGPNISLTPAGHSLFEQSIRLLGTATEITDHFRTHGSLTGTLRLGVIDSFALVCLEDLLRRLDSRFPALMPSVRINDSATLMRMLRDEELDVGVVVDARLGGRVRQVKAGFLKHSWVAGSDARLPPIKSAADLANMHIMLPAPPSLLHAKIMDWFATAGVTPTRVSTCNSYTVAVRTVISGLAIGVLPIRIVESEIARHRVRRLPVAPALPMNSVSIGYQTGALGPGLKAIVDLHSELIAEHRLY